MWDAQAVLAMTAPEEVRVITLRRDGSRRRPTIIWIVAVGGRVFVRSTNGRSAAWFRGAVAQGEGQILASGTTYDVRLVEAESSDLSQVDSAYRRKYARYASIVDHLVGAGPREATLEVPQDAADTAPDTSPTRAFP